MELQIILLGILAGGVLAAAGMGFSLVFGVLDITNFAHGALIILGSFITYTLARALPINPFLVVPITMTIIGIIGWVTQKYLLKHVVEKALFMVLVLTIGLATVIREVIEKIWGSEEIFVRALEMGKESITVGGIYLPLADLYTFLITIGGIIVLFVFLQNSSVGRNIRACREDREAARIVGVNVDRTFEVTMAISGVLAGLAGAMIVMLEPVASMHDLIWTLNAFVVVVLGGMGSMIGVLVGGLIIGIITNATQILLPPGWTNAILYILLILVLIVRPTGILGTQEVSRK